MPVEQSTHPMTKLLEYSFFRIPLPGFSPSGSRGEISSKYVRRSGVANADRECSLLSSRVERRDVQGVTGVRGVVVVVVVVVAFLAPRRDRGGVAPFSLSSDSEPEGLYSDPEESELLTGSLRFHI